MTDAYQSEDAEVEVSTYEPEPEAEPEEPRRVPATLPAKTPLAGGGAVSAFVPQSLDDAFRIARAMSMSGMVPRGIDTPEKVLVAIMAGAEVGMPPFQAVQSIAVINGRPTLWGDGMLAVVRAAGFRVREWITGHDDDRTAYCELTNPRTGEVTKRSFSIAQAKTAKLWGKKGRNGEDTPWVTYPDRMQQMRARSWACRDGAAHVLRGLPMAEEAMDSGEAAERGQRHSSVAERLQSRAIPATEGFTVENPQHISGATAEKLDRIEPIVDAPKTVDEVIDGDTIPAGDGDTPKRKRRTKAEMDAAREQEAIERNSGSGGTGVPQDDPAADAGQSASEAASPASDDGTAAGTLGTGDATTTDDAIARAEAALAAAEPLAATQEPETEDEVQEGCAAPGETYFLAGDVWGADSRRPTYVDGVRFSSATRRALDDGEIFIFDEHAPEPGALDEPPAAEEPVPSTIDPGLAEAIEEFRQACRTAESYLGVKHAMGKLSKAPSFGDLPEDHQKAEFIFAYMCGLALADAGRDPVKITEDPSFYQLWLYTDPEKAEVDDAWMRLVRAPAYRALKPAQQDALAERTIQAKGETA